MVLTFSVALIVLSVVIVVGFLYLVRVEFLIGGCGYLLDVLVCMIACVLGYLWFCCLYG